MIDEKTWQPATSFAGCKLFYYEETESTNNDVKRLMAEGEPHGVLAVAEKQTAGKGRRGRTWISDEGCNIFMSLGLKPEISPDKASMLTLVMAMAVNDAICELTGLNSQIKWPNDIVVNHKKVCGILTEMEVEAMQIRYVVIGVGINVNQTGFPEEIKETATSLFLETAHSVNRQKLMETIMRCFEKYYALFLKTGDLTLLKDAYEEKLVNLDAKVKVLDPRGDYEGIAKGIDNGGQLLVSTEQGIKAVYAGEVSVRGYYGYA